MKKFYLMLASFAAMVNAEASQRVEMSDTVLSKNLSEVMVSAVRAQKNAPYAVANITKKELTGFSKSGRELPFLFAQTPGVLGWSENGMGTGTSYLRIRGAGDSRINITLDGVPLNSPEDQCVFWANMNSYASLLGSVQIQRGIGASTNGDGAFGGTVSLQTSAPSEVPTFELTGSYGSYNTYNMGASFSTGLLFNRLIFDGAYHETTTDGYIHGTSGRSGSYYGGLTWLGNKFTLHYKNIGNFEKTGQAWNGVTAGSDDLSLMNGTYGANTGINTYKDMYDRGLGRYNSLYEYIVTDADGNFVKDAKGNYTTARYKMNDGRYWDKTTDNFYQNHNILSGVWDINSKLKTNIALHYTYGYGYYKEFKPNCKLKKFGFSNWYDEQGNEIKRTDFVRKKGMCQHTYGVIWNLNYKDERWDVIGGLNLQQFRANHFGYVTYAAKMNALYTGSGDLNIKYYDSDAKKYDYSGFVKAAYNITNRLQAFADVQYRYVRYTTSGKNDKFYKQADGSYKNQELNIDENYNFVNPKLGLSYTSGIHRLYASAAMGNREPERNNFTDNGAYQSPKAERVFDYELGYQLNAKNVRAGVNLYYMDYKDQFVQTGELSDIGEKLTTNIDKSYRMGVELTAGWDALKWLTLEGNAALSSNKIKDFDEVASVNWEDDFRTIHYDNSTLAFSPSAILNGFVNVHLYGVEAVWHTNFVSRQYLDNTECKQRSLPCFSTSNLSLSYTSKVKKAAGIKEITFGCNMNNLFGRRYATSGWVYSTICESYGHPNDNRYYQIGFVPSAGFTAMGFVSVKF